ncbi:hypothetical protein GCM10009539_61190 [Cryptosporangium japonicum]|uniref:Uncharacterized protein n=1 Tax=Cryptosporangium japonicum TaxID=80872 RepID=A0ABN0UYG1_9ACTN
MGKPQTTTPPPPATSTVSGSQTGGRTVTGIAGTRASAIPAGWPPRTGLRSASYRVTLCAPDWTRPHERERTAA